jgi:hypothetical protein
LGSKLHNQWIKGNTIQHLNSGAWTALKGKVANYCTNSHMQWDVGTLLYASDENAQYGMARILLHWKRKRLLLL